MAAESQTFSESWYRIAGQRVSLRPTVKARRQNFRGERWIILENPFSNQFFRLRPAAYEFVARLRPDRTVQEVWQECLERFPDEAPGQEAALQLLGQLYQSNLLHYDQASDAAQLFERYRKNRQREVRAKLLTVMFMRFPLLDPDQFLVRTLPFVRKLISPIGALIWLAVVVMGLKVAVDHWPGLKDQSQGLLAPDNLILLYLGLVVIKTLHEFGHAYFCRRYGGEVHVMGIMLMIFTPIPYMDATSSWAFRERWKRVMVGAAGMIVEIFVAAIAVFVWANTGAGALNSLAYNMIFIASVSTILFNINPLLRFDGYYILSDLLEIPNLHQRSGKHLRHLWERYIFGVEKSESPAINRREAIWLTTFGILSNCYKIFIFTSILLFVADRFLILGVLMALFCLISWLVVPVFKFVNYLASSPNLARCRPRAVGVTLALIGALFILLEVIPFPSHFRAPGLIQAVEWTEVVNEAPGIVRELPAKTGTAVRKGDPLLRMVNPELELELAEARASLIELDARLRLARHDEIASIKPLLSRREGIEKRIARLEADLQLLTIRARHDGIWIAPQLEEFHGRWLLRGTGLGLLVDASSYDFTAIVAQEDGDRLFQRKIHKAEVRLFGEVDQVLRLGDLRVIPAEQRQLPSAALGWMGGGSIAVAPDDPQGVRALEPFFEVKAAVADSRQAHLFHGRSGRIRFELDNEPLLPRGIRRLRQLLQNRYQL
jgi:putative peptide zinc metalloprotease protein